MEYCDAKYADRCSIVERTGYYTPFLLSGVVLTSLGLGLMSLLMPDSEACMWVGFQIIYGIGRGISLSTVSPFVCSALRVFVFLARIPCGRPPLKTTDL